MSEARYQVVVRQLRGDDLNMNCGTDYMPIQDALLEQAHIRGGFWRQGFVLSSMPRWDCALLKRGEAEIEVKLEREAGT